MTRLVGWQLVCAPSAMIFALFVPSCATKDYVRTTVDPLDNRVGEVERRTEENATTVSDLDRRLGRVDEIARGADDRATDAGRAAALADEKATQAEGVAKDAQELAEAGAGRIETVERVLENFDNYRLLASEDALFAFGRSDLGEEARVQLDALMARIDANSSYAIEVEGHTDPTGSSEFNLGLSQRRAEVVLRYLTDRHDVPLRRVFNLGVGSQRPVADNKTREGRRRNRRVEVRVYVPKVTVDSASPRSVDR